MIFTESPLAGAFVIDTEPHPDDRGFFARVFCSREFEQRGLRPVVAQSSISFNLHAGTLRGLHWQAAPHGECKLIRCTQGAVYDVIVDLRAESPTFRKWFAVELSAANRRQIYVPENFAHGFQTLFENTEVHYQMSEFYAPDHARGARWNDPAFAILWPETGRRILHPRDASYPDFTGPG